MTDRADETEWWLARLQDAYVYARKQKLRELNGDRRSEWSGDGLHTWSHIWGGLDALCPRWLLAEMADAPELLAISPKQLRDAAEADALDEFVARIRHA